MSEQLNNQPELTESICNALEALLWWLSPRGNPKFPLGDDRQAVTRIPVVDACAVLRVVPERERVKWNQGTGNPVLSDLFRKVMFEAAETLRERTTPQSEPEAFARAFEDDTQKRRRCSIAEATRVLSLLPAKARKELVPE